VGWIRTMRHLWDTFEMRWYELVVGYGQTTQRLFLERLGFVSTSAARLLGAAAVGVASILALLTIGHAIASRLQRGPDPVTRAFGRFVRRLRRHGVRPPAPHETPSAYAERAARALPGDAAALREIAAAYLAARYEPDRDGDARRRLEAPVRRFRPRRPRRHEPTSACRIAPRRGGAAPVARLVKHDLGPALARQAQAHCRRREIDELPRVVLGEVRREALL